ncbi:ATP-binding protein [Desulfosporosinus sp. SYSU MS00001]|uniref:ATP-binding protein n=1 Tax=Desulfosporosinus sp. SYSU MS00001 TaxID=3416284 RepID=UPI003CEA7DAA
MKQILLSKMEIKNFKGIREFTLDTQDKNAFIFARNGKGKSTLRDACLWCLAGKDGQNRTEGKGGFDIETFQPGTNEPIHGIDHVVEVALLVNSKSIKFKRLYAEKWTKKHGALEKELTGHTTSYWIDDESMNQKEYLARIAGIIQDDLFRLLTDPYFFNNDKYFPWDKRRKLLMEMAGGLSDEEILNSDPELQRLKTALDGKSIDAFKKIVAERLKLLKNSRTIYLPGSMSKL